MKVGLVTCISKFVNWKLAGNAEILKRSVSQEYTCMSALADQVTLKYKVHEVLESQNGAYSEADKQTEGII